MGSGCKIISGHGTAKNQVSISKVCMYVSACGYLHTHSDTGVFSYSMCSYTYLKYHNVQELK